ncbi:MAG TPA: hypothetical protein K8V90_09590 [Romboutsia timonensis]|uniref:Uncharacterized protein n=1 Tax=Romboutsia timonensis TaxID=1776391 RepID=A0A921N1P3_9FIRM|nr:hypothetical protein [uncultured Romboutsia sp.]HJG97341.1 hypothetical protein [Romboutsia timonensis]
MQIEQLDLETRSKIYNYTKKILRKYQKGIITGKLTADKFVENILSNGSISDILDENLLLQNDFKQSYTSYIENLINIQNESLSTSKKRNLKSSSEKPSISQRVKLKNLLESSGYTLSIPLEYLSSCDVDCIIQYITTQSIDIGNERIYNYVHKSNLN